MGICSSRGQLMNRALFCLSGGRYVAAELNRFSNISLPLYWAHSGVIGLDIVNWSIKWVFVLLVDIK